MKKRWYKKSGIKGLLVLLTIFFVTVSCVGAGTSVVIMNTGVQPLDSKIRRVSETVFIIFRIRLSMRSVTDIFWIRHRMMSWSILLN